MMTARQAATFAVTLASTLMSAAALPGDDRATLENLAAQARAELNGNILPFWINHARDTERGGFHGQISTDLTVDTKATRGALLTSRILWTYSAAYRLFKKPQDLEMARWAYKDLIERFWDDDNGGLYWSISAAGKPIDTHKQVYGQVFGIYALSEYHRAIDDKAALDRAVSIYRLIETHARDSAHGGYYESFSADWKTRQRSLLGGSGVKSQNTHIHVLEAYTNLLRVWPDEGLRANQVALIEVLITRILDAESKHLTLFLDEDWNPRSGDVSYGHDIEFAWLLTESAHVVGDPALIERTKIIAADIARVTLAEGFARNGGLYNESGPHGITDPNHDWWPQAESVVGFLNAYQITGDASHLQAANRSWEFIQAHITDHEHGEWFWGAGADGRPMSRRPKVALWKCPYHNGRACMEIIERVAALTGESDH